MIDDDRGGPLPVARSVVLGCGAIVVLVAALLVVRPLIFSVASPRDDSVYAVAATGELVRGPIVKDLLLNAPHRIPGEQPDGGHALVRVVIAPFGGAGAGFTVVNAYSSQSGCAVRLAADRLLDCRGTAWTINGEPITSGVPALMRFPTVVRTGAIIVDFTQPVPGT